MTCVYMCLPHKLQSSVCHNLESVCLIHSSLQNGCKSATLEGFPAWTSFQVRASEYGSGQDFDSKVLWPCSGPAGVFGSVSCCRTQGHFSFRSLMDGHSPLMVPFITTSPSGPGAVNSPDHHVLLWYDDVSHLPKGSGFCLSISQKSWVHPHVLWHNWAFLFLWWTLRSAALCLLLWDLLHIGHCWEGSPVFYAFAICGYWFSLWFAGGPKL